MMVFSFWNTNKCAYVFLLLIMQTFARTHTQSFFHTKSCIRMWFLLQNTCAYICFFSSLGSMIPFEIAHTICLICILLCRSEFIADVRFLWAVTFLLLLFKMGLSLTVYTKLNTISLIHSMEPSVLSINIYIIDLNCNSLYENPSDLTSLWKL